MAPGGTSPEHLVAMFSGGAPGKHVGMSRLGTFPDQGAGGQQRPRVRLEINICLGILGTSRGPLGDLVLLLYMCVCARMFHACCPSVAHLEPLVGHLEPLGSTRVSLIAPAGRHETPHIIASPKCLSIYAIICVYIHNTHVECCMCVCVCVCMYLFSTAS